MVYKFDTSILLLILKAVVNQLWQMVCKSIKTCKFVLDTIVRLHKWGLYSNKNDILLVYWVYTCILYHQNPVNKSSNCDKYSITH